MLLRGMLKLHPLDKRLKRDIAVFFVGFAVFLALIGAKFLSLFDAPFFVAFLAWTICAFAVLDYVAHVMDLRRERSRTRDTDRD